VCNPDAIIIKKLGCFGSPKIIKIIATSLTSNNFTDAHKWPQEYNKPIPKWGKQHFPRCNKVSSQESERGHLDTLKSQDFPSQNFSKHWILGYYSKHASIYGIVNYS
jgi:hypothetical protein